MNNNIDHISNNINEKNYKKGQGYQGMIPIHDKIKNKRHALRRLP